MNWRVGPTMLLACIMVDAKISSNEIAPQQMFAGHSQGSGTLTYLFGKPRPFHVESHGQMQPDGKFRLDQNIVFEGDAPNKRHWIIETVSPGVYSGTLSDAAGEVSGRIEGNRLILRYRAKGWFVMHQTLEVIDNGRAIDNKGRITLLGIPVGQLHETIVRIDEKN